MKFTESPSEHHIQTAVLERLFAEGHAISFTELKPADIENSLFMYHVRKLEQRGLIERSDEGFVLTVDGARWVNFTAPRLAKPRLVPRLLVTLVMLSSDGQRVLLARRNSAVTGHLNLYLVPGGFPTYGVSLADSAVAILEKRTGQTGTVKAAGTYEAIYKYPDGYVHHVVCPVFTTSLSGTELPDQENYEYEWVSLEDVSRERARYGETVATVVEHVAAGRRIDNLSFVEQL